MKLAKVRSHSEETILDIVHWVLAAGSTPPVPVAGCAPWERQWQNNTRLGERV